jgi:hypothetical protein
MKSQGYQENGCYGDDDAIYDYAEFHGVAPPLTFTELSGWTCSSIKCCASVRIGG